MQSQNDKVNRYYDATVLDYKFLWTGRKDLAIHFGYFDQTVNSHTASLLKMNEVLAKYANISPKDRVLDAGCGYGGSSIWLAKNIGCKAVGINIVPWQVKIATKSAKKHKVSSKVIFKSEDYCHTSFQDKSFDVVWGLESIVHATSKKDFIGEAYRLLRKEGRIIICEYMLRESAKLSEKENKLITPWLKGWAMPSLLTPSEYKKLLEEVGFKRIKINDITPYIEPSLNRLRRFTKIFFLPGKVLNRLKIISDDHFGNAVGAKSQLTTFDLGLWRYIVITGQKIN